MPTTTTDAEGCFLVESFMWKRLRFYTVDAQKYFDSSLEILSSPLELERISQPVGGGMWMKVIQDLNVFW